LLARGSFFDLVVVCFGSYSKGVLDRAIAHGVGDANSQAYHRERLIEERRPIMQAWSDFAARASL
jgi:hypothetical protein